jgi:hypothetical protein
MQWKDLPEDQRQLARDYNRARKERIAAWGTKDKEQIEKVGDAHEDSSFHGRALSLGWSGDDLASASRLPEASGAGTISSAPDQSTESAGTKKSA